MIVDDVLAKISWLKGPKNGSKLPFLLRRVFNKQLSNPKHEDWITQIKKDIKKPEINKTMDEIAPMSKTIVKDKIEAADLRYLKSQINSKGKEMKYDELTIKKYLVGDLDLTNQEKIEAFKIRSKMVEVKSNMKNKHENVFCFVCKKEDIENNETQEHIWSCHEIKSKQN